jgi:hypothetical protein
MTVPPSDFVSHPPTGMKTTLPAPEEYYRPARARELRERAARLERWIDHRWRLAPLCLSLLGAALCALIFAFSFLGPLLLGLGLALTVELLALVAGCLRAPARLREQAAALEAEHQARYGALPPGEGD